MSTVFTILLFMFVFFAGRLVSKLLIRPYISPRFSFEEIKKLFSSRDVQVLYPPPGAGLPQSLFQAQLQSKSSNEIANYLADKSSPDDEFIALYEPFHKKMEIRLNKGNIISIEHGGPHTRTDFTNEELDTLTDFCSRVRSLVKAPAIARN